MIRVGSAICAAVLAFACSAEDSGAGPAESGVTGGGAGTGGSAGSGTGGTGTGGSAGTVEPTGCDPAAIGSGTHAYFDSLRARPECHVALSLRDPQHVASDLDGGYAGHGGPLNVTYDFANDPYPYKQDAAKIVIPADKNSLPNQVKLPIYVEHGERALITWDAWFGPELDFSHHGIPTYKMWQFSSFGDGIWCEVRARWSQGPNLGLGALAGVDGRTYSEVVGPNVTSKASLEPQLAAFTLHRQRWVRYWGLFEPDGDYDAYSLWMADEDTDPVKIFDRLQLQFRSNKEGTAVPRLGVFRIEFNTSHNTVAPNRGELIAYVRNYVVLSGDVDPTTILARPTN